MRFIASTSEEAKEVRKFFTSDPFLIEIMQLRVYVDADSITFAERLYKTWKKLLKPRINLAANMIELDAFVIHDFNGFYQKYSLEDLHKIFSKFETSIWYNSEIERHFLLKLIERKMREKLAA